MPIDEAVLGEFSLHTFESAPCWPTGSVRPDRSARRRFLVSAQSWHSDAIFSILIGGDRCDAVTPSGRHTWGG